ALGALLLEQGHVVEAAQVYRADLGLDETLVRPSQHMGNVWSLHGYAECCRRLGHGDEAAAIEVHLEQAQAVADIPIHASCFCRQVPECCEELHGSAYNTGGLPALNIAHAAVVATGARCTR